MSWLSKALGGNALKIGVTLLAGGLGREYLYGSYGMSGTGIGAKYQYSGDNIFGSTLKTLGVKPFQETALGKSVVGSFLDYLGPRDKDGNRIASDVGLFDTAARAALNYTSMLQNAPDRRMMDTTGFGVRSDTNFGTGSAQMIPVGRGGQVLAAADRNSQYFARQVRGMGLPGASKLPSPNVGGGSIQTTSMRSRGYKKLGLGKG